MQWGHQHAVHLKEKICWSDAFYSHSFSQVYGSYLLNVDRHVQESVNKKFCRRCSCVVGRKKFSRARLSRSLLAKRHFLLLLMFCSLNTSCLCLERNRPINTGVWLWVQNAVVKWCLGLFIIFSLWANSYNLNLEHKLVRVHSGVIYSAAQSVLFLTYFREGRKTPHTGYAKSTVIEGWT